MPLVQSLSHLGPLGCLPLDTLLKVLFEGLWFELVHTCENTQNPQNMLFWKLSGRVIQQSQFVPCLSALYRFLHLLILPFCRALTSRTECSPATQYMPLHGRCHCREIIRVIISTCQGL